MTVNATHATRARRSHRPCKVVRRGVRALIPGPLIPDPALLPPLPQHHSTVCSTPERYEEKSIKNISLHQLPTRMWRWGMQVSSLASVLTVNTPLTPSESHENGF